MSDLETKSEIISADEFEKEVIAALRLNNLLPDQEEFYGKNKFYKSSSSVGKNESETSFQNSLVVRGIIWSSIKETYGSQIEGVIDLNILEKFIFTPENLTEIDQKRLKDNSEFLFGELKNLIYFPNNETDIIANVWNNFIAPIGFLEYEDEVIEKSDKEEDKEVKKALNEFIKILQGLGDAENSQPILKAYENLVKALSKNPIFAELFEHDMKSAEQGITVFDLFNYLDVEQWDKSMGKYENSEEEEEKRFKMINSSFNHIIMIVQSFFESKNKNSSVKKLNSYLNGMKTFFEGRNKEVEINLIIEDKEGKKTKIERDYDEINFLNIRQGISLPHIYRLVYGFLSNAFAEGKGNADSADIQIIAKSNGQLFLEITQDGDNVKPIPQELIDPDEETGTQKIWEKGKTISTDKSGKGLGMNPQLLENLGDGKNIKFFNISNDMGRMRGGMRIELTSENVLRILNQIEETHLRVKKIIDKAA